jgi:hypothetical protein
MLAAAVSFWTLFVALPDAHAERGFTPQRVINFQSESACVLFGSASLEMPTRSAARLRTPACYVMREKKRSRRCATTVGLDGTAARLR